MGFARVGFVRKIIVAVGVAVALFVLAAPAVFAAVDSETVAADVGGSGGSSLKLTSSSPKQGSTDLQSQNVGIKLLFDGNVADQSVRDVNRECFEFTYQSGKETKQLPVRAIFGQKESERNYILVIVDTAKLDNNMLANNQAYQLKISGDLSSAGGGRLGSDTVLDFKTVDQSSSTNIYILLMVGMVGAMIAMTIFQNKRKEKAAAEVAAKGGRVNPYKFAKEKKISVKEAMELIERDRKRRMKRLGIAEGKSETAAAAAAEKPRNTRKVKAPKPISAAGSTYKTGRSALVEKRAKEALEKAEKAAKAAKAKNAKNVKRPNKGASNKNKKKKK